jgi:hypothetical protein
MTSCFASHSAAAAPMPGEPSPTGVKQHGVARLERHVLACQSGLDVSHADLVRRGQHVQALRARHVDEHAAREQRADILHTEFRKAVPCRHIADCDAVVEGAVDRLMREHVELCPDLAQLGDDDLLVAGSLVGS